MTVSSFILAHSYVPAAAMLAESLAGLVAIEANDLVVTDPAGAVQVLGTDYEVTGDLRGGNGSIRTLRAYGVGEVLTVTRATERVQLATVTPFQPLPSRSIERELDRRALIEQEQDAVSAALTARALLVPVGETIGDLPPLAARLGKALEFDLITGDPVVMPSASGAAAAAAASAATALGVLGQAQAEADAAVAAIENAVRINALRAARGRGRYVVPEVVPCLVRNGSVVWAATTAINSNYVTADNRVYWQEKNGTSGATKPTSRAAYIIDGAGTPLYLSFIGELAPVAYANSLTVVLGQQFYANGNEYKVTVAGSFAGAGAGPATGAGGTDGTVTFIYLGPQTKPVLTFSAAGPPGTTSQAGYNSSKITIMSGVAVDDTLNGRRRIRSVSGDGISASGGGGKFAFRSDAPLLGFYYFDQLRANVWVDGELIAAVDDTTGALSCCNFDFTGLPRKERDFVIEATQATQFIAILATAFDSLSAYVPDSAARAVLFGDSFAEARALAMSYPNRLAGLLGIEDFRIAALGGTGLVQTNGALVNYQTRFDADVVSYAPDFVFIQMSQNDQNGIPGSWSTATVSTALASLIARARAAQIIPIVIGPWNSRGVPTATVQTLNSDAQALCNTLGVAFIDWMDFLTDGGFVGSPSGSGNSLYYTEKDGVHPSFAGMEYRAIRLAPLVQAAIDLGAGYAGYGAIPSAAQVAAKVSRAGDTMLGKLNLLASAASGAGVNVPPGAAPTVPVNGDLWTTAAGFFARIAGITQQFVSLVSPAFSGTPTAPTAAVGTKTAQLATTAFVNTPSIYQIASASSVTPSFIDDQVNITAQAAALTLADPTGTAQDGHGIAVRIKDNGVARAIAYGAQYRPIGVTLPVTTVAGKTLYLGMIFNAADTKWDVIAAVQQA